MEDKSSSSGSLRRRPDHLPEEEIEEGEIRGGGGGGYYDSGSETEGEDDDRYVFQSRRDEVEEEGGVHAACKRRRLEDVLAESREVLALPSPTPSFGSDGTISDHGDGIGAAAAAPVARVAFPCHLCNKEFGSRKAVHGHMRVHQGEKEKESPSVHLSLGWASTGKRGGNGRAVTVAFPPTEEELKRTQTLVLAELAHAAAAARTYPDPEPTHHEPAPSTIMVAEANPPNQVVDHNHHLPAALPYVRANHHHAPAQPATAAPVQPMALLPEAAQGGPYRCKFEGCNKEYKTHQGLGGHVAGHINREKAANAASSQGSNAAGAGAKPEGKHRCKYEGCHKEFFSGVALGGHMRKHYTGKVIMNKKKQKHNACLRLSLAPPSQVEAPAPAIAAAALPPAEPKAEVAEHGAEPVPAPAPTNRRREVVRIFGVDFEKPADAEEQHGGSD